MIDYLIELGVTAVELLPVHAAVTERPLAERGLSNYWGYNTIGYFRARSALSAGRLDRRIQDRGQAPARGRHRGHSSTSSTTTPARATSSGRRCRSAASTISSYYRLQDRPPLLSGRDRHRQYAQPRPSARHADGLRLVALLGRAKCTSTDSVSTCARHWGGRHGDYSQDAAFFDAIRQDPVMAQVKLISEPWDVGPLRLPARQFSAGLGRVERPVPRRGPALLEGRQGAGRRNGVAARRVLRHFRLSRPAAMGQHQFRHRP